MQGTKDRGAHAEYLSSMSEVVSGKRYSLGPGLKWSSKPWLRVEIFCQYQGGAGGVRALEQGCGTNLVQVF